ncbi:MAG: glycosyltransferase family 4 protein [Chitinophagaceae bacterium]|nr:glycosyltransferase family 4 protein [Chitinophagaceae bacterium]
MKKLVAVHLLNDFSGSPFVFRQALLALQQQGVEITLHTATPGGEGFLSGLTGVQYQPIRYRHSSKKWWTLLRFLLAQWQLFWRLLLQLKADDTVYINTLLPMGAALAARLRGCQVVYHIHEVSIQPAALRRLLTAVARATAHKVVFVSQYVANQFSFEKASTEVVYNALDAAFVQQARQVSSPNVQVPFVVLMLCSLKAYKGVYSMLELARRLPAIRFHMVLNSSQAEVDRFARGQQLPENVRLYSVTKNTLWHYQQAHLVVNLSHPDKWIETFGLTLLEAMACGRPVIAPPVGGPLEVVTHGLEGYCIDARDIDALVSGVEDLYNDFRKYVRFADNARRKAEQFSASRFATELSAVFGLPPVPPPIPDLGSAVHNLETAEHSQ